MKIINIEKGVYEINSGIPGTTVSIVGGIHGNEPCGLELLKYLKDEIRIKRGKIFLIKGNLDAIEQNVRQCDVNLNRIFKQENYLTQFERESREYQHMQRIKKYLNVSDACLDIHSSPTFGSPVFAIGEENCFKILNSFSVSKVCTGFSEIEPGGTDYYMYKQGKVGICLECGNHNSSEAFKNALESTMRFLNFYNLIAGERKIKKNIFQNKFQAKNAYITQTNNFLIERTFSDFESIIKGEVLGYDGDKIIKASVNGVILFARNRTQIGVEAFVELEEL